jgi:hypothetical protein
MSDFFRRASDALQHRQRQGSADSTDAPTSPNAAKQPEQDMANQQVGATQPEPRVNEASAGGTTGTISYPVVEYLGLEDTQIM